MNVPFLDLKKQYQSLAPEIEPEILKVFRSCSYIGGDFVKNFESEISSYINVKHAIGCSSGTAALMLALRACGVKPGDEVITTAFSFFATAEAIASVGGTAVFADVKPDDYTIDPTKIEDLITSKTKVILPVHIFGATCDMDAINAIAKKHNLKVVEDAAQAIGSEYKGKKAGTLGDIGCFSFYPTKNLGGCGDGGMLTTNNDDLATIILAIREHGAGENGAKAATMLGYNVELAKTNEKATSLYNPYKYYNYLIGYNSRLDAIQACALSIKLKHLDDFNKRRADIAEKYFKGLTKKVKLPQYSKDIKTCWHQFVFCTDKKNDLCSYLSANGVGNGTFYPVPLHQQKAFNKGNCKNCNTSLPVAEKLAKQTVCLPIFPEMEEEQINYVIKTVNSFFGD